MKLEQKVIFDATDIEEMVKAEYLRLVGAPPKGYELAVTPKTWERTWMVEACKIPKAEVPEIPEPAAVENVESEVKA